MYEHMVVVPRLQLWRVTFLAAFIWTTLVCVGGFHHDDDDDDSSSSSSCLQLLSGHVGGGNYTYYRLSHEGDTLLTLHTVLGDADIYASQLYLQPTYELNVHDLQSVTCGIDRIHIPATFKRPVGIGVYGHPSHEYSAYQLCVNLISLPPPIRNSFDSDADTNQFIADNYAAPGENDYGSYDQSPHRAGGPRTTPYYDKDDEESVLWSLLISALKVILEILT